MTICMINGVKLKSGMFSIMWTEGTKLIEKRKLILARQFLHVRDRKLTREEPRVTDIEDIFSELHYLKNKISMNNFELIDMYNVIDWLKIKNLPTNPETTNFECAHTKIKKCAE